MGPLVGTLIIVVSLSGRTFNLIWLIAFYVDVREWKYRFGLWPSCLCGRFSRPGWLPAGLDARSPLSERLCSLLGPAC